MNTAAPPLIDQELSRNMPIDRYKKGEDTGVFASKYNFGINNLRYETAAVHTATYSKRKSA